MRLRSLLPALAGASLMSCASPGTSGNEVATWERQAQRVTITRDDWGVPHVKGKSDADAVFGLIYAQAEDDFNRIEVNYLTAMGRMAEADGRDSAVWADLRMKLFVHPDSMRALYAASPEWLRTLCTAWADGLNFYLYKHPEVKPRVLSRFEPWMALTFSEGSIGGDIERISLKELKRFYGSRGDTLLAVADDPRPREPSGSNGFALAPSVTASHHAILWINPHTSFFFREEAQVTSDEGLNAYGAITWGQFFVYQGFNARAGWMHTTTGADFMDEYAESIVRRGDSTFYKYGTEERRVTTGQVTVLVKSDSGPVRREFTVYRTHHGPVVRARDGRWISVRLMQEPVKALTQSFTRTKAANYAAFKAIMELHTNSSNNTIFADAEGNIAYFHANFVPRRDTRFDWRKPVDGSNPATEWKGLHAVDESPLVHNPANGWLYNTNNSPWSAAGPGNSPRREAFPAYMENNLENPRGVHALRVLAARKDFTIETVRDAAFDSWLPAFDDLLPALTAAYDRLAASDPLRARLAEPVTMLRGWDRRWGAASVPTTVAVFWGEELWRRSRSDAESEDLPVYDYMVRKSPPAMHLAALAAAIDTLAAGFGTWKTPWGEVNRFQRLTGDIVQPFSDAAPSIPVPFASSRWGSLASFGARAYKGTKKWYGTNGNSFVAGVEFGDSVRAMAVTAGGLNSVPGSRHFNDQAVRYTTGDLRPVYFHPSQLKGHVEREYHPGG